MESVTRNNWELGWLPGEDEFNGPKNCLLRMDNVTLDENGSLNLARGTKRISSGTFTGGINKIFSRNVPGSVVGKADDLVKLRYVSHNNLVVRNYGALGTVTDFDTGIVSGGSTLTAFGSGWDQIFIFSGTKKRRDKGTSQANLGIPANSAPAVTVNAPPSVSLQGTYASWTNVEGTITIGADYIKQQNNSTSLRGIAQLISNIDATALSGSGSDTPNDIFKMLFRPGDTSKVVKVRIECLLDTPTGTPTSPDVKDYYWFEWILRENFEISPDYFDPDIYSYNDRDEFIKAVQDQLVSGVTFETFPRIGTDFWGQIQCLRSQFKRVGTDDSKNWTNLKAIRVGFIATEATDIYFSDMKFEGGLTGGKNGWYSYLQVDVYRDGTYCEVGLPSAITEKYILGATTTITPTTVNGAANECWIFRSSSSTPGYFLLAVQTGALGFTPIAFNDTSSDVDIVRLNVGLEYGRLEIYRDLLPDYAEFIIGPYFDRMLLFDSTTIYPTYKFDCGSVDGKNRRRITGDSNEVIMWVKIIVDGLILVGTTEDIYALRGDFSYDPATTLLNFTVESLGIEQPPIHKACAVYGTSLIYLAEDGWRVLEGTSSYLLSPQLDMLYKGYTRYNLEPVALNGRNSQVFRCVVSKSRFVASVHHETLGRALHIYDFNKKTWRFWRNYNDYKDNPQELYTDDDGTVIYGTALDGDNYLYQWDVGTQLKESVDQQVYIRFVHEDVNKSSVFKDGFCLKITGYTAGDNITLNFDALKEDGTYTTFAVTYNSTTRGSVKYFALNEDMVARRYNVIFNGAVTDFELNSIDLTYLSREERVTWLRIPATDFGESASKQFAAIPLRIDTFGQNVDVITELDAVAKPDVVVNTGKWNPTVLLYFNGDWAKDVGFIIEGGVNPFEFLGIGKPEILTIAKKTKYFRIGPTNFGNPHKKLIPLFNLRALTDGQNVTVTPYIDNAAQTPITINSAYRKTHLLYMSAAYGIDYEFILTGATPFEVLELLQPEIQDIFKSLKYFKQRDTNFNNPDLKLIHRFGVICNTDGNDATLVPSVDGTVQTSMTINGGYNKLHWYYFTSPIWMNSLGFYITSSYYFDTPILVEPDIMDSIKLYKYHRFGPIPINRQASVRMIRIHYFTYGTPVSYILYEQGTEIINSSFVATTNKRCVVEISLSKSVKASVMEFMFSCASAFHIFRIDVKFEATGSDTENQWVTLDAQNI